MTQGKCPRCQGEGGGVVRRWCGCYDEEEFVICRYCKGTGRITGGDLT